MTPRRAVLKGMAATVLIAPYAGCASCVAEATAAEEPYADTESADRWMQAWIEEEQRRNPSAAKGPNGALHLGRFADPTYYLTSVIGWDPDVHQAGKYESVRVPVGFVTDFASIPRVFWAALRPDGLYSYSAVVHDYLYWEQYLSREMSDEIFKLCMEDFKIDAATVQAVYNGVRVGGGFAWSGNTKRKAAGERRVLKRFPTDPTIRWDEWKKKADVF